MIRADIALAVTRLTTACVAYPLKCQQWPRHGRGRAPNIFEQFLDIREARCPVFCRDSRLRSAARMAVHRQQWIRRVWRDVRQGSQILIQADRTEHSYDVRSLCTGSILRGIGASRLLRGPGALGLGERARTNQRHKDAEEAKS